jgi:hypothetical protein
MDGDERLAPGRDSKIDSHAYPILGRGGEFSPHFENGGTYLLTCMAGNGRSAGEVVGRMLLLVKLRPS